jgi:polyisoprenoid-binding protein YceI
LNSTLLLGINNYDGVNKAAFEVVGHINRKDFGLTYNTFQTGGGAVGQHIKLIANLQHKYNHIICISFC